MVKQSVDLPLLISRDGNCPCYYPDHSILHLKIKSYFSISTISVSDPYPVRIHLISSSPVLDLHHGDSIMVTVPWRQDHGNRIMVTVSW